MGEDKDLPNEYVCLECPERLRCTVDQQLKCLSFIDSIDPDVIELGLDMNEN